VFFNRVVKLSLQNQLLEAPMREGCHDRSQVEVVRQQAEKSVGNVFKKDMCVAKVFIKDMCTHSKIPGFPGRLKA
jgi:hypothetical protein